MTREHFEYIKGVPVANLALDTQNARIRAGHDQADCIARILRKPKQLLALAADIAAEGLSTAPILVQPIGKRRYRVWDGNRRVTVLKLLNDPMLCPITVIRHQLEGIKNRAAVPIPTKVDVLSSDDEASLLKEVLKRHSGQLNGAGQMNWSAFLRTLFLIGHGEGAADKRAGQLFLWAEEHGVDVDDEFPITSITRFLTKSNLKALGFDVSGDAVTPLVPIDKAVAVAQRLAHDFGPEGAKKVDDIFGIDQQDAYIRNVRLEVGIDTLQPSLHADAGDQRGAKPQDRRQGRGKAVDATEDGNMSVDANDGRAATTTKTKGPAKPSWDRKYLFSKTGAPGFNPSDTKAANIVAELRKLDPNKTPIAVAALFRMLLEFSTKNYISNNRGVKKDGQMHKQIAIVADHMRESGLLTDAQVKVVHRRTKENEGLMNYDTLGAYMHSPKAHPHAQGLNALWDEVDDYVKACWS